MEELQVPTAAEVKKARRQTAFYPAVGNVSNTKPFSKSAARRESVLALGSIEHLQFYFTKTGIAAKKKAAHMKAKGLVLAIGGGHGRNPSSLSGIPELTFELPPSPVIPQPTGQPFADVVKNYETDPEELLPDVIRDLENVSNLWFLGTAEQRSKDAPVVSNTYGHSSTNGSNGSSHPRPIEASPRSIPTIIGAGDIDILALLKATTQAIRSVRNYLVALPEDIDPTIHPTPNFRPNTLSHRPSIQKKPPPRKKGDPDDPLSLIRRAALNVLTTLRDMEEKYRLLMTDDSFEVGSDNGSGSGRSRVPSPSARLSGGSDIMSTAGGISVVNVPGRGKTVSVWADEEENPLDELHEMERREGWDEKLVLGGGWLYRNDAKLGDLEKEREVISNYLDTVDSALFSGDANQPGRGWGAMLNKLQDDKAKQSSSGSRASPPGGGQSSRRNRRTGLLDVMQNLALNEEGISEEPISEEVDESHLPKWAKRTEFLDDPLGRALALLVHLLPVELLHLLPPPNQTLTLESLMVALSSGQLLCVAYNIGVRKSKKPWGYINKAAIHDIAALEAHATETVASPEGEDKRRKGWTFRRTENLKLWSAALKLRYMVPLLSSSQLNGIASHEPTPASSPVANAFTFEPTISTSIFDAAVVAKREGNWQDMLQSALFKWVDAVVSEKRGQS